MSLELKASVQGKSCFNFKSADENLFMELEQFTAQGFDAFKQAGFMPGHTLSAAAIKSKSRCVTK